MAKLIINHNLSLKNKRCQTAIIENYNNKIPIFSQTPLKYNDLKYVKRKKSYKRLFHNKILNNKVTNSNDELNHKSQPFYTEIFTHFGNNSCQSYYQLTRSNSQTNGTLYSYMKNNNELNNENYSQRFRKHNNSFAYNSSFPKFIRSSRNKHGHKFKEILFNEKNNKIYNVETSQNNKMPIRVIDLNLLNYTKKIKEHNNIYIEKKLNEKQHENKFGDSIKEYNEYLNIFNNHKLLSSLSKTLVDSNKFFSSRNSLVTKINNCLNNDHKSHLKENFFSDNKYINRIVNRVSHRIKYINQNNKTITQEEVINFLLDEYKQLNDIVDNHMEAHCKIKNFSILCKEELKNNQLDFYLLPFINQIIQPFYIKKKTHSHKLKSLSNSNIQVNLNREQGLFSLNKLPNDSSIRKTFIMNKKKQNNSFDTKKYSNNNLIKSKGSQRKKNYMYYKIMVDFSKDNQFNFDNSNRFDNDNIIIESSLSSENKNNDIKDLLNKGNELPKPTHPYNKINFGQARKFFKNSSLFLIKNLSTKNLINNQIKLDIIDNKELLSNNKSMELTVQQVLTHSIGKCNQRRTYKIKHQTLKIQPTSNKNNFSNQQQNTKLKTFFKIENNRFNSESFNQLLNGIPSFQKDNMKNEYNIISKFPRNNTVKSKVSFQHIETSEKQNSELNPSGQNIVLRLTNNSTRKTKRQTILRKNKILQNSSSTFNYYNQAQKLTQKNTNIKGRNLPIKLKLKKIELTKFNNSHKHYSQNTTNITQSFKTNLTNTIIKTTNEQSPKQNTNEKNKSKEKNKQRDSKTSQRNQSQKHSLRIKTIKTKNNKSDNNETERNNTEGKEQKKTSLENPKEENGLVFQRAESKKPSNFILFVPLENNNTERVSTEFNKRLERLQQINQTEKNISSSFFIINENITELHSTKNKELSVNDKIKMLLSKDIDYSYLKIIKDKIQNLEDVNNENYITNLRKQFQEEKKVNVSDASEQSFRINAFLSDLLKNYNQEKIKKSFYEKKCKVIDVNMKIEISNQN